MAIRNKELWTRNSEPFEALPDEVKTEIRGTCKVYDRAFVTYYYGTYHVSAGYGICSKYPADHRSVGVYFAEDIYTEEERMVNYIECFHDFPHNYKGRRDYGILRGIEKNWDVKFKFEDGNLVRVAE